MCIASPNTWHHEQLIYLVLKKKNKGRGKMKESYLDELMDMVIHHLVRGNARDFLQLLRSNNFNCPSQGRLNVSPDAGPYLLFTFFACFTLLLTSNYLLNKQGPRNNPTLVQGRGGWTLFLSPLSLSLSQQPSTYAGWCWRGVHFSLPWSGHKIPD